MKRYTSIALVSAAVLSFQSAQAMKCDLNCKNTCITEGLGDSCVSACGCQTMSNGAAEKFAE